MLVLLEAADRVLAVSHPQTATSAALSISTRSTKNYPPDETCELCRVKQSREDGAGWAARAGGGGGRFVRVFEITALLNKSDYFRTRQGKAS